MLPVELSVCPRKIGKVFQTIDTCSSVNHGTWTKLNINQTQLQTAGSCHVIHSLINLHTVDSQQRLNQSSVNPMKAMLPPVSHYCRTVVCLLLTVLVTCASGWLATFCGRLKSCPQQLTTISQFLPNTSHAHH